MANQAITLARYLKAKGPLPAKQVARIAYQVVQQLHKESGSAPGGRAPVVYPGRVAVGKNGAAQLLPMAEDDRALPVVAGFPAYVSPEEIRGGAGDFRSSLYSLGCALFELLTGQPPFLATSPKETLRRHLKAPLPEIQAPGGVDSAFAETLRELLQKDPELRIQSAQELVRRLKQSLTAAQPAAQPAAPPARRLSPSAAGKSTVKMAPVSRTDGRGGAARRTATAGRRQTDSRRPRPKTARPRQAGGTSRMQRARPAGSRGRMPEDEWDESAEEPKKRGIMIFTITGALLGCVISAFVIMSTLEEAEKVPELERQARAEFDAKRLEHRKETFRQQLVSEKANLTRVIENTKNLIADEKYGGPYIREAIKHELRRIAHVPGSVALAKDLVFMSSAEQLAKERQDNAGEEGFETGLAAVKELWAEDRWGAAIQKLRDLEFDYKATHGAQINEIFNDYDKQLGERWDADLRKAKELASQGEASEASRVLEGAKKYGDEPIRKKADEEIEFIQAQALLNTKSGDAEEEEEEEEAEDEEEMDEEE